ncbi:outer membrane beta-barrel family protein [Xylanibacter ruminicola]|uniref:Outer membrane receptor proteins, mostly Fe transport n=1 Tax=Xylanibacter ruminicola TaxID=839 RepID=A0A1M6WEK1_XYLRU|nr:outer membrane beta-barrel family protein [Xylanibacter ruminicola]SHK91905.1 Outer membrane receptor proteins, mostly Fe transport [Xylanibacter ruminicola]
MKRINVRLAVLMAAIMMTMMSFAKTQDFGGRVIDEKGEPMPFVNVVLLSLPDSAFVQGSMTNMDGVFKIVTDVNEGLFKVTSVGYQTLYIKAGQDLTIQMKEDTQLLSEVVVKGQLPKTHAKGDAMRTTVAGTILEKAGTVSDALGKIPSIETERGGSVTVLGRGDAEVYINGRKVQDLNELSRLRSDQIQHVDVVQNPGARYKASTKAVVRITLKKAQGEGFSFQDYFSGIYQYGHTLTNNLDVNYRTGGLDITASLWAGRYGHAKSLQEHELTYFVGPDYIQSNNSQESKSIWKGYSPQLQLNYMVDENHSFGAFYKYDRHPSSDFNSMFFTDNYVKGKYTEHSESRIWQDESFSKHIFNAYYNGKVGNLGIDLNIDGLFDDTKTPGSTTEQTSPASGDTTAPRTIESNTLSGNNFWATKLILSYPVWKGNLSLGGEYSYNHRTDAYSFMASDYVPVKTTDTEINEKSSAAFLEYGRSFGKVYAQVGLRYEHLTNDYFNFGKKEDEVCRDYGDWFPTAVISAPVGKAQLSLSYRRDIERPNYANLTSSTVYVNRYTYQSGNPYLLPTYTHSLVLNAAYKWANLMLNYGRVKDALTMSTEPFPGSEDPLVSLVRPINSWEDYNKFSIQLSARPTIGCWHPMWTIITQLQDFKSPTADGSTITLNHPWFILGWQNDIELPHGFRLNASLQWYSKGDYNNFRMTSTRLFTNVGLQRDFNLKRMGTLTFDLRCSDIFHTNKTDAIVFGYRELTTHNPARRTFVLDLTWKFNEARSKYRGSGAGEKQKARM